MGSGSVLLGHADPVIVDAVRHRAALGANELGTVGVFPRRFLATARALREDCRRG